MKRYRFIFAAFIICSIFIAAGMLYGKASSKKKDAAPSPEVGSAQEVAIFRAEPSNRAYAELGNLEVNVPERVGRTEAIMLIKQKAFDDYKADAVINVLVTDVESGGTSRKMTCPTSGGKCYTEGPSTNYKTRVTGTAVKWK